MKSALFVLSFLAMFVVPACIGVVWTTAELDLLTGYAPSYLQFFGASVVASWLSTNSAAFVGLTDEEKLEVVVGRLIVFTLAIGFVWVIA